MVFIPTFVLTKRKIYNMDYSKVKFVKPSVSDGHFKKGKAYSFDNGGHKDDCGGVVGDDRGIDCYIYIPKCAHLSDNPWIPCHEDGTPLIKQ